MTDASASAPAATAATGNVPRRGGRPAAARAPAAKKRWTGNRNEVPVVVDERVHEPKRERHRKRRRRVALRAVETPDGADRCGCGRRDEPEQKRQPDDPRPGEELERNAVRLRHRGRELAVALACDLEALRPRAHERVSLEDVARLSPPSEPVVRAQAGEPARVVPDLLAPELVRDAAGVGDEADDGHERNRERKPAQQPRQATPPARRQRTPRELAGADGDERSADDQEQPEPGAVGDAVGV